MKLLPLITSVSLVLFLAQSAPAKPVSVTRFAAPSIVAAQVKFCEQWKARQRSVSKGVDQWAVVIAEILNSPRKMTVGEALRELHPDGKTTLSDVRDDQIVFISTTLEKGESAAISKAHGTPSYDCPDTYTLIKNVSNGKGHAFIQQYVVMYLPRST